MYTITTQQLQTLIQYLDASNLPHGEVKALMKLLSSLPLIEETGQSNTNTVAEKESKRK